MQRVLVTNLSVLMLLGFSATITSAETSSAMPKTQPSPTIHSISPNDLVAKKLPPEALFDAKYLNIFGTKLADLSRS